MGNSLFIRGLRDNRGNVLFGRLRKYLSMLASSNENKINITRGIDIEPMAGKSAYAMLREMFSLQGRIESICEPGHERTLTVGSTDNILLDIDLERIISSSIYDYALDMTEHIFKVNSDTTKYNIAFEKKYEGEDIYVMDTDWEADISVPLIVFEGVGWVTLGGTCVLAHNDAQSNMSDGAYIFQGIYKYVKRDLFGRTYWKRISNTVTIRKGSNGEYEFKEMRIKK